jgi:hypothetical protein
MGIEPATFWFVAECLTHYATAFPHNVNILCKYLMYILTDYRLILTKGTKDKPDLSSEKADTSGTALARTSSNSKL